MNNLVAKLLCTSFWMVSNILATARFSVTMNDDNRVINATDNAPGKCEEHEEPQLRNWQVMSNAAQIDNSTLTFLAPMPVFSHSSPP